MPGLDPIRVSSCEGLPDAAGDHSRRLDLGDGRPGSPVARMKSLRRRGDRLASGCRGRGSRSKGRCESYLRNVTRHWLLPAPEANPAMLAMFRDRDRRPYRDLLPWSGEFAGKYLTGATGVLRLTGDPELKRHLERFVRGTGRAARTPTATSGRSRAGHRLTGHAPNVGEKGGPTWDAWGHYHVMLGLLLWDEEAGDPGGPGRRGADRRPALRPVPGREAAAAGRHRLDRDEPGAGARALPALPPHGQAALPRPGPAARRRVRRRPAPTASRWPATTCAAGSPASRSTRRPSRGGRACTRSSRWPSSTGSPARPRTGRRSRTCGGASSSSTGTTTAGSPRASRPRAIPYHRGAIETCCTIAWMAMSVEMLAMTGDSIVADELELSTLNSALGMLSPSGRWSTYNTPMDGVRKANFHEIGFQCRPGSPELNCCSVNAARGLGLIGEWAVMRDADGLFLNWYGPGTITAPLESGGAVKLVQETDLSAHRDACGSASSRSKPGPFALRLRIPHWSTRTAVKVNGEPVAGRRPGAVPGPVAGVEAGRHGRAGARHVAAVLGRRARMRRADVDLPRPDPAGLRPPLQRDRPGRPAAAGCDEPVRRHRRPHRVGPMPPMLLIEYPAAGGRSRAAVRLRQRRRGRLGLSVVAQGRARPADPVPPDQPAPERAGG